MLVKQVDEELIWSLLEVGRVMVTCDESLVCEAGKKLMMQR